MSFRLNTNCEIRVLRLQFSVNRVSSQVKSIYLANKEKKIFTISKRKKIKFCKAGKPKRNHKGLCNLGHLDQTTVLIHNS